MKEDLKDKYPFTCPECGAEQVAEPSMLMGMGINEGHGSCLKCHEFLHLEIIPGGQMKAVPWEDYVEQLRNDVYQCRE